MFGFSKRTRTADIQRLMRRVCDLTTPNITNGSELQRGENRYNRAIPTLVCPYSDGQIDPSDAFVAITKDLSDEGVGLILTQEIDPTDALLAIWLPPEQQPWFFHACVRRCDAIGGGYWIAGLELLDVAKNATRGRLEQLLILAQQLLPPQTPAATG